jgi:hypothetical protein
MPTPLITMPWNTGTFSRGTTLPKIARAPCSRPEAPKPSKARPKIKMSDVLAVAHTIDPASTQRVRRRTFQRLETGVAIPSKMNSETR